MKAPFKHKADASTSVWNGNWIELNGYFIWWQISAWPHFRLFFAENLLDPTLQAHVCSSEALVSTHMFILPDMRKRIDWISFRKQKFPRPKQKNGATQVWKWRIPFVDRGINASLQSAWSTWIKTEFFYSTHTPRILCASFSLSSLSKFFVRYPVPLSFPDILIDFRLVNWFARHVRVHVGVVVIILLISWMVQSRMFLGYAAVVASCYGCDISCEHNFTMRNEIWHHISR